MAALLLKLRTWWETADRTQKAVTLFGGGFLLLLLGATFYFASRPRFEMAFGGLSPSDQGVVVAEIQKMGIPVEFDVRGNVLVPSSKVAEVKAQLAVSGKLPETGHVGNEELANLGMMITPSVERERLKTILEGELARSIEFIEGVERARVHVSLGDQSAFANESQPATASVTIDQKGGGLTSEQARAIARLVANAVTSLEMKNVSIVSSDGRALYDGEESEGSGGIIDRKLAAEEKEARRRERLLQAKLDDFFGRGNTSVTFDISLGFDHGTERKTSLRTPEDATPITEQRSEESMSSAGGGGIGGEVVGANMGGPPGAAGAVAGGTSGNYRSDQKVAQYPYDQTETNIQRAAGDIKKMTVAVMVNPAPVDPAAKQGDANAKKLAIDKTKVEEFVRGYLGLADGENSDEVVSFKVVELEKIPTAAPSTPSGANPQLQQIFSFLPILALLVVGFMVMKAIGSAARAQNVLVTALPGGGVAPMGLSASQMPALEEGTEFQPMTLDASGQAPAQGVTRAIQARQQEMDVGEIQSKLNVPLEQIKKMSDDRPEVVAMLIKSWLLEDRR
ncbi:MAG TPA: flagellar M-ring protein FliF C-terminal domain-containing protein [Fimbriimonadaceae bacterium]|nr:flagellar M-ring protein FliF C-terminal domain-containing protein [Fimbriimonadaceae bacterium]